MAPRKNWCVDRAGFSGGKAIESLGRDRLLNPFVLAIVMNVVTIGREAKERTGLGMCSMPTTSCCGGRKERRRARAEDCAVKVRTRLVKVNDLGG